MSGENTEAAGREVMEALGSQNLERLIALSDPEVEWHSLFAELGAGGVYCGHEGTRRYIKDVLEAFEIVRADVDGGLGVGDVAVLVGRIHYRGRGSGVEHESPTGWVLKFRDGKLIYFRAFREPAQAFETVGLTPEKLSEAKLEIVQRWVQTFNRQDVEGFLELWDADCEFFTLFAGQLAGAPYSGHEGLRRYCEERSQVWAELRIDTEELRPVGDRLAMIGRIQGRGRGSGAEVDHRLVLIFELRGTRVLRVRSYSDRTEALEGVELTK
jgi:ketosteroid isomerase-like protein